MALLRTCGSRSAVQNCSAETAAFHIEYSHAKGQYCEASMVLVCRWNKIIEGWLTQEFLVTYSGWRHWHEIFPIWSSMDLNWAIQVIGICPLMWQHVPSVLAFLQRWKIFYSLSVNLEVHMFDCGIKWLLSFHCKAVMSLRDAVTGPILSPIANHVCSSHCLDFGYFYPMIWI